MFRTGRVESLKVKALAFGGAVVMVSGKRWGVLLLDSQKPFPKCEKQAGKTIQKKVIDKYAVLLGKVLEEIE